MATEAELEDLIQRQSSCIRSQLAEIESLRAEVDRLNGVLRDEGDALAHLRRIYSDTNSPLSAVLKAAGIAVNFERPRPPSVTVNAGFSLYDFLEKKRLERHQVKPAVIDAKPDPTV
jgi:hypothetical protein